MRRVLPLLLLVFSQVTLCYLAAGAAAAHAGSGIEQVPAAWANYSHTPRSRTAVRLVVVHVTESSFAGAVAWFRNRRAQVSAHYVVGRDGEIAHMVPDADVAWHAGNGWVNEHSLGIENEGLVGLPGTFTDAEYRASARLVASLLRRYRIPADRRHVIGHDQVPDPNHPGEFGGYAHHTDPGAYWDWARYMAYVRAYLAGRTPPPPALDVAVPGLELGQTLTGTLPWTADVAGEPVAGVEFLLDGTVLATATAPPYSLVWNSATATNGRHMLQVRATGLDGRVALASVEVETRNAPPPPPLVGDIGLADGATVSGLVHLAPALSGGPVARVELWVDGKVAATATAAPWALDLDATALAPGQHTVAVRAVGPRGGATASIVAVTVAAPASTTP